MRAPAKRVKKRHPSLFDKSSRADKSLSSVSSSWPPLPAHPDLATVLRVSESRPSPLRRHHSLSLIQTTDNGPGIFNGCSADREASGMLYALIKQARKLANDLSNDGTGREIQRPRTMALNSS